MSDAKVIPLTPEFMRRCIHGEKFGKCYWGCEKVGEVTFAPNFEESVNVIDNAGDFYWETLEKAARKEGLSTEGLRELVEAGRAARKDGGR